MGELRTPFPVIPEAEWVLCWHPEHSAPAEILSGEEYKKAEQRKLGYVALAGADTYEEVLELLRRTVAAACEQDPELARLKQDIREAFR